MFTDVVVVEVNKASMLHVEEKPFVEQCKLVFECNVRLVAFERNMLSIYFLACCFSKRNVINNISKEMLLALPITICSL